MSHHPDKPQILSWDEGKPAAVQHLSHGGDFPKQAGQGPELWIWPCSGQQMDQNPPVMPFGLNLPLLHKGKSFSELLKLLWGI